MNTPTTSITILAAALAADVSFSQDAFEVNEARDFLDQQAEASRQRSAALTFEEFRDQVFKEPWDGGKYIVNGDTTIANEKLLREFYEANVANRPAADITEFTVHTVGGLDAVWSAAEKRALTYCVSDTFGARYTRVVADMQAAAAAWEAVADLDFIHVGGEDGRCNAANASVVFDVRPVDHGQYLARAFFPNEPRFGRNVLIDESSFDLDPNGALTLVGILRHEIGHAIGARHEHTRPEAGVCFEDDNWRGVTDYDAFSVMHYPQCNGMGDWSLRLTDTDKSGVACLYGPAAGFVIDTSICQPLNAHGAATVRFDDQAVAKGERNEYGPFAVEPGSRFTAIMEASGAAAGDPDLYLSFRGHPQLSEYDCRPYTIGADEECSVDVPAEAFPGVPVTAARLMVHGYRDGAYHLSVTHTAP